MPKGPTFRQGNALRHRTRIGDDPLWRVQCAEVDVDMLRVQMSVEYVRARGGLSYEERQLLRAKISEIQRPKEKRERRIEMLRERGAA